MAQEVTRTRTIPGAQATLWDPSYADFDLENSRWSADGGVLLGGGAAGSRPTYFFFVPRDGLGQGRGRLLSIRLELFGSAGFADDTGVFINGIRIGSVRGGTTTTSFEVSGNAVLDWLADPSGCAAFTLPAGAEPCDWPNSDELPVREIRVTLDSTSLLDRYDLKWAKLSYTYSGIPDVALAVIDDIYLAAHALILYSRVTLPALFLSAAGLGDAILREATRAAMNFALPGYESLSGSAAPIASFARTYLDLLETLRQLGFGENIVVTFLNGYLSSGPSCAPQGPPPRSVADAAAEGAARLAGLAVSYAEELSSSADSGMNVAKSSALGALGHLRDLVETAANASYGVYAAFRSGGNCGSAIDPLDQVLGDLDEEGRARLLRFARLQHDAFAPLIRYDFGTDRHQIIHDESYLLLLIDWIASLRACRVEEICGDGVDNDCDGVADDGCPVWPVFVTAGAHGTVEPSGRVEAPEGKPLRVHAIPDEGYAVRGWYIDGELVQQGGADYELAPVDGGHTVIVFFAAISSAPELRVLSPRAGERYRRGRTVYITWDTTLAPTADELVRIDLSLPTGSHSTIAETTENDGRFDWRIPRDHPLGEGFVVEVVFPRTSLSASSGPFSIEQASPGRKTITIRTLDDLQGLSFGWGTGDYQPDNDYVLEADIDARDSEQWDGRRGFRPLGWPMSLADKLYFRGTFDGRGHRILGLTIRRPGSEYVGFFALLGDRAVVKNLVLEGGTVRGRSKVGAIAGESSGLVVNCHGSAEVQGFRDDPGAKIGGIVGKNDGIVRNCSTSRDSTDRENSPELQGYDSRSVGGVVGYNVSAGTVEWCFSTYRRVRGEVAVGGVCGQNDGCVRECYSSIELPLAGEAFVGGVVGENLGTLADCYSTTLMGAPLGSSTTGGVAGKNEGSVQRCYATGGGGAGGLVGQHTGLLEKSFWDTRTTGIPAKNAIAEGRGVVQDCTGLDTPQMKARSTFSEAGWDLETVWSITDGSTYPWLRGAVAAVSAPQDITIISGRGEGVILSWPPVPGAAAYRIHRSTDQDGRPNPISEWIEQPELVDDTAVPGVTYYYWVEAAASPGGGARSELVGPVSGSRVEPPLDSPSAVDATDGLPGRVDVSWDAVPQAAMYRVFRSVSREGPGEAIGEWQPDTRFSDDTVVVATTYWYWVIARTDDGRESGPGGPDDGFAAAIDTTPPVIEVSVTPELVEAGREVVLHVAVSDDRRLSSVVVRWRDTTVREARWDEIATATFSESVSLGTVTAGRQVSYWVETRDEAGNAAATEVLSLQARPSELFRRGDTNDDGRHDISDAVVILLFSFAGGSPPACLDAADVDDSGTIEVSDPVMLLRFLFFDGPPPPAPLESCGSDPSADTLGCEGIAGSCPP